MANMPGPLRPVEPALGFLYDRSPWFSVLSRRNRTPGGEDTMRCIAIFTASSGWILLRPDVGIGSDAKESRVAPTRSTSQVTRLEVTRDTWVSEVGQEADGNNGGAPRLKLKSIQEMTLIDVDPAPLRGRVIAAAALHLKSAGDPPLRRVTVGGIGAQWFEGSGTGYREQPGGATFRHRRHPDLPWSIGRPGGDHLPCDPGQWRHELGDGRRDPAGQRRLADDRRSSRPFSPPAPRGSATGSWSSTTPGRSGPARANRFEFRPLSQPVCVQS